MSFPSVKETATPGLFDYNICGTRFLLDTKYAPLKHVGYGSYGVLCAAKDTSAPGDRLVVIEKVQDAFSSAPEMASLLTELAITTQLTPPHPNLLRCLEVMRPAPAHAAPTTDLYLVHERMAVDLRECKRSMPLDANHLGVLAYQLLAGLAHLHAAGVAHGEVRPSNLLIDEEFNVKLSKFGRAVAAPSAPPPASLEQPLFYYAPELLAGAEGYSAAADIWAAGAVLLETLSRKHVVKGRTKEAVLESLKAVLGGGDAAALRAAITGLVDGSANWVDLLASMLCFDPAQRVSAEGALQHPLFQGMAAKFEAVGPPAPLQLPATTADEAALRAALEALVNRQMP